MKNCCVDMGVVALKVCCSGRGVTASSSDIRGPPRKQDDWRYTGQATEARGSPPSLQGGGCWGARATMLIVKANLLQLQTSLEVPKAGFSNTALVPHSALHT